MRACPHSAPPAVLCSERACGDVPAPAGPKGASRPGGWIAMTARERASLKKALEALERELSARGTSRISPNRTAEEAVGDDEDEQPLNEMLQAIASSRNK